MSPNKSRVSRFSGAYFGTREGWLYLAGIEDVFTCEMVGFVMDERMTR